MENPFLPVFLFLGAALSVALGMVVVGVLLGPRRRSSPVKRMPYESGMDPIHGTRRRFDVRFHLVAVAFLIFDVELLFLYPWGVASRDLLGVDAAVAQGEISHRGVVFLGAVLFLILVSVGLVYDWRKGVLRWR
jgi:NADH-quinone oxidoreductase subunit A